MIAAPHRERTSGRPHLRAGARAIPAWTVLGGLIALSFAVRVGTAVAHSVPRFFPDEYIYGTLGRSLGNGSLEIRGRAPHFPALLEPLVAAPLWRLAGDVETGYRLVQGMHALAASLAAVPVYLLARRLGFSTWLSLACSAITLSLPAMVFSAYVTADAVALPLVLAAAYAGVRALERPTARAQAGFLALAGLAAFARVQYVVLPAAFVFGALVVSHGSVRRTVREYRLTVGLLVLATAVVAAAGASSVLGYYTDVTSFTVAPTRLAYWSGIDGVLLLYASGFALVPGALVGLALALTRPRTRAERGFAAFFAGLAGLLLSEAVLYASNGTDRFQERYLVSLLPLVPLAFCLGARRFDARGVRRAVALVAMACLLLAATLPLGEFTVRDAKQDSPTLQALNQLQETIGLGNASLAVSLVAAAFAALAAAAPLRPRVGVSALLASTFVALAAASVAAVQHDLGVSDRVRRTFVPEADLQWVDSARLGPVSVLETPGSSRPQISEQLFWNRSLVRILQMPESAGVDKFGSVETRVAGDGRILAAGRTFRGPLLVQEHASWATLDGARLVRRSISSSLWRPEGTPRMALLLAGRYLDGWLDAESSVTVWPKANGPRRGVLRLELSLPTGLHAAVLDLRGPGIRRVVRVAPGERRVVEMQATVNAPWRLELRPRRPFLASGTRIVAAKTAPPRFVERP